MTESSLAIGFPIPAHGAADGVRLELATGTDGGNLYSDEPSVRPLHDRFRFDPPHPVSRPVAVVLAAGQGKRMASDLPKVLHHLDGEPLVHYPLSAAKSAGIECAVVVVGHGRNQVERAVVERFPDARFAIQAEQRGTGHAVMCAMSEIPEDADSVVILSGDVPLLRAETIRRLRSAVDGASPLALLSFHADDATGYGRIVRDAEGLARAIREHRDASPEELEIHECNAGVYCVRAGVLRDLLPRLRADNAQGELYLTDLVAHVAREATVTVIDTDPIEVAGVNTRAQLDELEQEYRRRRAGAAPSAPEG